MSKKPAIAVAVVALGACLFGCTKAAPSREEIELACLTMCKKELPGTVEVNVQGVSLARTTDGQVVVTGRVSENYAPRGVFNGLTKDFSVVFAKQPTGWHPVQSQLRHIERKLQQDGAARR